MYPRSFFEYARRTKGVYGIDYDVLVEKILTIRRMFSVYISCIFVPRTLTQKHSVEERHSAQIATTQVFFDTILLHTIRIQLLFTQIFFGDAAMGTLTNSRPAASRRINYNCSNKNVFYTVKMAWAILRTIAFVWTSIDFFTTPAHAQNQRPVFPVVMGNNIVGRIVVAGTEDEAMTGVVVRIAEMDLSVKLDSKGFFNITNVMNGKYTVQILAEGSNDVLSTQTIMLRGHDVRLPTISVERGEYVVCGRVTFADNRSLGAANVRVSLGNGIVTTTDARGYYVFDHLRYNAAYTLKVSLESAFAEQIGINASQYVIYGAERTVKVQNTITRQNFIIEHITHEGQMAQNEQEIGIEVGRLRVNSSSTLVKTSAK